MSDLRWVSYSSPQVLHAADRDQCGGADDTNIRGNIRGMPIGEQPDSVKKRWNDWTGVDAIMHIKSTVRALSMDLRNDG